MDRVKESEARCEKKKKQAKKFLLFVSSPFTPSRLRLDEKKPARNNEREKQASVLPFVSYFYFFYVLKQLKL